MFYGFDELLIFEQEPQQILDALLPLYMNGTVLRALQESLASELAARMMDLAIKAAEACAPRLQPT